MVEVDRKPKVDIDRRLAVVAAKQHSLITLADLIEAGGSLHHAKARVRSGRWEAVSREVYRLAGVPWTYDARVMALVLAAGPEARASVRCAARLKGIGFPTARPEVSVPRGRNHRPKNGHVVHESTDLDRSSIDIINGIPTTDTARTLLDLGRYIGPKALARAVEQARRLGLTDWHDLIACLSTHARRGRHGVRRLRQVIAEGTATAEITDTDGELAAVGLLREHGFGEPVIHHQVRDSDGEILAEFDVSYPDKMVAFEIDGPVHLRPEVKEKDESRDHAMRMGGWTIRRVSREMPVQEPERFIRIVRKTFRDIDQRAS